MTSATATAPTTPTDRGARIEISNLTKRFGTLVAVDDLTFTVEPGRITGFLGPNGAGKTTTLRMLLGLVRPSSGSGLIGGKPYADLARPLQTVGSALEATNFHPGRSGRDHLRVLAAADGVSDQRVDQLLELVGIPAAARQRAGGYSMGMRQRLGLAAALLGDPQVLILDEPANGLDPEGIRWLRGFLRHLAGEGKTLLISSHMLSEVEQTVDDVVIIANGRLVRQGTIEELHGEKTSIVRTRDAQAMARALTDGGVPATVLADGVVQAEGDDLVRIGDLALAAGQPVHELRGHRTDLEQLFFNLTESPENQNRNLGPHVPHDDMPGAPPQQGDPTAQQQLATNTTRSPDPGPNEQGAQ